MTIRVKYVDVHFSLSFIALVPIVIISGYFVQYIITFLSIVLHELSHIYMAAAKGGRPVCIKLLPVGICAEIDTGSCGRRDLIAVYSAGPAANLLLAGASYLIYFALPLKHDQLFYLSLSNFYLAAFNLIPAVPLDGGRILQEIFHHNLGFIRTARYLRYLALFLSLLLFTLGTYQILTGKMNFTLLLVGLYIMFICRKERMEASLMNIKQLLYRRTRLLKKGCYPARELVVLKDVRLSAIIKAMDYDSFHMVYVLETDLKLIRLVSENDIIEGIMKYHGDMTFEELIKTLDY